MRATRPRCSCSAAVLDPGLDGPAASVPSGSRREVRKARARSPVRAHHRPDAPLEEQARQHRRPRTPRKPDPRSSRRHTPRCQAPRRPAIRALYARRRPGQVRPGERAIGVFGVIRTRQRSGGPGREIIAATAPKPAATGEPSTPSTYDFYPDRGSDTHAQVSLLLTRVDVEYSSRVFPMLLKSDSSSAPVGEL